MNDTIPLILGGLVLAAVVAILVVTREEAQPTDSLPQHVGRRHVAYEPLPSAPRTYPSYSSTSTYTAPAPPHRAPPPAAPKHLVPSCHFPTHAAPALPCHVPPPAAPKPLVPSSHLPAYTTPAPPRHVSSPPPATSQYPAPPSYVPTYTTPAPSPLRLAPPPSPQHLITSHATPSILPLSAIGWTQDSISQNFGRCDISNGRLLGVRETANAAIKHGRPAEYLLKAFPRPIQVYHHVSYGYLSLNNRTLTVYHLSLHPTDMVRVNVINGQAEGRELDSSPHPTPAYLKKRLTTKNGGASVLIRNGGGTVHKNLSPGHRVHGSTKAPRSV